MNAEDECEGVLEPHSKLLHQGEVRAVLTCVNPRWLSEEYDSLIRNRGFFMAFETTVIFRHMEASPALCADVVRHADKLELFAPGILACHVTVDRAEHRHRHGSRYVVRACLTLPGIEFEAGQTQSPDQAHEDPHHAVTETFDALRRQLQQFMQKRREHTSPV
ncbi:MAG TPA: HPF/RaiA family ribosome-associated protein [Rudaea sp.]|nr:HPF/RaiA family ribosome-associated protein [Rudaea sp.]HSC12810.1 HPF/RaiA family ribosome-associated protein [Rhodanobacteraceae bacterium]